MREMRFHCANGLVQWFSNFHEPWLPSKFNLRILNRSFHLGYAISRQNYLVKASARGLQRSAPWTPRGPRAPFEKPWSGGSAHLRTFRERAMVAKNAFCWQQGFFFTHVSLHIV